MRILVTGITGQVGSALLPRLEAIGTTIPADRASLDLTRIDEIPHRLEALAPDLIINPAAYTAVDRAEDESDLASLVNTEAPRALAEWAAKRKVPLIHFSTDYVFNGSGTTPWRETDAGAPLSIYGKTKLAGEVEVRASGCPHLIVRTSWVYAAQGTNFLRTMMRLAKERRELRVVADQLGAPTSADVIAHAVTRILTGTSNLPAAFAGVGGTVHLTTAGYTSWHGFASAIVEGLRARNVDLAIERIVPIATSEYPTRAQRPLNSRLDLSILSGAFGVTPPAWADALQPELDRAAAAPN